TGNEHGFFSIDPVVGVVRLAKALPLDHTESILTARATDGGKYPLSDTANVRIKTDAFDGHGFRFTRELYQRTVRDTTALGSVLLVVSTLPNGVARYSMKQPCSHFDVHAASGAVILKRWLTRERAKSVACTVIARNRAGEEDTTKVLIKTSNTNQHSPIFKQQVYRGFLRENSPGGSSVLLADNSPLLVSATDKDVGPSALIGYRLLNPNEPYFVVDFVTGAVRSRKPVDFEKLKEWIFYVQASDMGDPVRASPIPAMVIVSIIDTNDQKPVFTKSKFEVDLVLPTVAGRVVARPTAKDEDTVGKLRYSIKGTAFVKLFSINFTDGSIILLTADAKLLNETKYKLEVIASDGVHTASAPVYINVKNTSGRNTGFRFPQMEYHGSVKENTSYPMGEPLLAVTAVGAPEGASVTYSILNEREELFIHDGTGMIALTGKRFDREAEPIVRVLIQARTHESKPQLVQTVVVFRIDDVNDCTPVF
ncbi:cadherin domain protein, partial [Ancylostoma caninum]